MYKYVLKRLLMLIPVIIGVTFIVFFILNLSPGDPAAIILGDQASAEALAMKRKELGLDDPLLVRYGHYMINMLHGDLGTSYKNNLSVWSQVMERFPNTAVLAGHSFGRRHADRDRIFLAGPGTSHGGFHQVKRYSHGIGVCYLSGNHVYRGQSGGRHHIRLCGPEN